MGRMVLRFFAGLVAAVLLASPASAQTHWVGSWATSQQIPEERNALAPHDLDDATLRQTVHLFFTGASIRVRLSSQPAGPRLPRETCSKGVRPGTGSRVPSGVATTMSDDGS